MNNDHGSAVPSVGIVGDNLGIGHELREARERKRLSKVWLANHLHLNETAIDAIESERFAELPAPVFVKGYIRAYARAVGLDYAVFIERYAASLGEVVKQPAPLPKVVSPKAAKPQPVLSSLVALGLVVTLATVWSFTHKRLEDQSDLAMTDRADWSAISVARAESIAPGSLIPASGQSIVFEFTADSWVKVRDKNGEKVLRGMMPAGTIHGLTGLPPFDITLGNSAGVVITRNGVVYDHNQHVRGNVAHFALGQ